MTRRAYYASEIVASPRYQEPAYLCNISAPSIVISGIYQYFLKRRRFSFREENVQGTLLLKVKVYLPVSKSFGFIEILRITLKKEFPIILKSFHVLVSCVGISFKIMRVTTEKVISLLL